VNGNVFVGSGLYFGRFFALGSEAFGYRRKPKKSSQLIRNMYNLGAFGFAVVSSTPRNSVTRLSVICLYYRASSSAYLNQRDTATSWKQEQ
jgi:hypothetical protein